MTFGIQMTSQRTMLNSSRSAMSKISDARAEHENRESRYLRELSESRIALEKNKPMRDDRKPQRAWRPGYPTHPMFLRV